MKKSGIYLIKNTVNNKVYIGSAVNIDKRWKKHKHLLNKGKHHSCHLQCAWNVYGEQNFTFDVIEEVINPEHLLSREQAHLDLYKSYEGDRGYNICKVAGSWLGTKHSEETKRKMSEARQNRSEEHKQKLREAQTGKKLSEETKKKISEVKQNISEETRQKLREASKGNQTRKGKKHTEETKHKMSEAKKGNQTRKGKKHTEETKHKMSEAAKRRKHSEETNLDISTQDLVFLPKCSIENEHAFYYTKKYSGKVKLDFEHDDFKWINPKNLSNYKVVPDLLSIIAEVWEKIDDTKR